LHLRWLSTEHSSYPRKITKNTVITGFHWISVEIIDDFFNEKVIHSQVISPCTRPRNPPLWRDSGCPDKYMKTQCN
jgi:hypothetical protein